LLQKMGPGELQVGSEPQDVMGGEGLDQILATMVKA